MTWYVLDFKFFWVGQAYLYLANDTFLLYKSFYDLQNTLMQFI